MTYKVRTFVIFLIMSFVISFSSIYSQISITSSDILALKGTSRDAYTAGEETDTVVITPGGMNQIWDYRNLNMDKYTPSVLSYSDPEGGFRSELFPEANFRSRMSGSFDEGSFIFDSYMNISTNILRTLGAASDFAGFSFIEVEDDDAAPLPMTYGVSWISVSNDTSDEFGFTTITNDSTWNLVDAFGTLRLSMGDFNCLRLKEMSKTVTESSFNGVPIGPPDTTYEVSYVWLSKNHLQTLIVDGIEDDMGEVTMAISTAPTSVNESFGTLPSNFNLNQNYPNPFNPTTLISYSIPTDGFITLSIFDVLGKEVAILENAYRKAGNYSYQFDASTLSSGFYFYTLKSGDFVQTKKMLLMK